MCYFAVHRVNGMKGSIYMVFDYMDHDLTGLMEREGHRFTVPQVTQSKWPALSGYFLIMLPAIAACLSLALLAPADQNTA